MIIVTIVASIIGLYFTIKLVERYGDNQWGKGYETGYKTGRKIGQLEGHCDGFRKGLNAKAKDATE